MRLGRMARTGAITDMVLLAIFISLAFVFMNRKGYLGGSSPSRPIRTVHEPLQRDNPDLTELSDVVATPPEGALPVAVLDRPKTPREKLIDPRITRIADSRPEDCRGKKYHSTSPITIVIDFYDYQFYDLKITMGSLLLHTPMDMVSEIIVIDDGSSLDYIIEDSKEFTRQFEKVRLVRNDDRGGSMKARVAAMNMATSEIVVFLDTNVVCNEEWLPPLVALLEKEKSVIAVPHFDSINDPVTYDYTATPHGLVAGFSLSMTVRMSAAVTDKDAPAAGFVNTPLLRGNAFAVRKNVFKEIGRYDKYITDSVAANMELSFRTWMCGFSIKSVTCSRVGILSLNDASRINSKQSVRRIAELWLGDKKGLVYKNTDTPSELGDSESYDISRGKRAIEEKNCKDFDWYLREVGMFMATPSPKAAKFGLLKSKTNRCAHVADDNRIELGSCSPPEFRPFSTDMIFEFTTEGRWLADGKCLATTKSAYIVAEKCKDGDQQLWDYKSDLLLINKWSGMCTMHVSDPDPKARKKRQIIMVQNCKSDKSESKQFSRFDFISF